MARPLTVVQLLPALDAGGVERSTLEISAALLDAGHRAIVVSAGGRLLPALQAIGAEHIALPVGRKSPLTLLLFDPALAIRFDRSASPMSGEGACERQSARATKCSPGRRRASGES